MPQGPNKPPCHETTSMSGGLVRDVLLWRRPCLSHFQPQKYINFAVIEQTYVSNETWLSIEGCICNKCIRSVMIWGSEERERERQFTKTSTPIFFKLKHKNDNHVQLVVILQSNVVWTSRLSFAKIQTFTFFSVRC